MTTEEQFNERLDALGDAIRNARPRTAVGIPCDCKMPRCPWCEASIEWAFDVLRVLDPILAGYGAERDGAVYRPDLSTEERARMTRRTAERILLERTER